MTDSDTPRTAAGRRLLDDWIHGNVLNRLPADGGLVSEQIARIEAEAAQMGWQEGMSRGFQEGETEAAQRSANQPVRCDHCGYES